MAFVSGDVVCKCDDPTCNTSNADEHIVVKSVKILKVILTGMQAPFSVDNNDDFLIGEDKS